MNKKEYDEYLKANYSEEQIELYDYFHEKLLELNVLFAVSPNSESLS